MIEPRIEKINNTIEEPLARHGLMGVTVKQSLPTIMNINRPHLTLLNNIMKIVTTKHAKLGADLHALDRQQQDEHKTRLVQTDEFRRHRKIPNIGIYTPIQPTTLQATLWPRVMLPRL